MENDNSKDSYPEAPKDLSPATTKPKTNVKTGSTKGSHAESENQKKNKWSIRQHWKAASRPKQLKAIATGAGTIAGVLILGVYIWNHVQSQRNFVVEHRPRVVFSRPPQLIGTVGCYVTDKAIHLFTGEMRVWVKNIGHGEAVGAFVIGPQFQLVPEKKTGVQFLDTPTPITDDTCKLKISPKAKEFPVHIGEEVSIDMQQAVGAISLIRTNEISVSFGAPQPEPQTPPGEKPEAVYIAHDAIFQMYAPICVYYFDQDGNRYGGCSSYRLVVNSHIASSDPYGFSCTESPVSGHLEQTLFGYCQN
jgi:hypothetical protein